MQEITTLVFDKHYWHSYDELSISPNPGIYVMVREDGRVMYIGESMGLRERFRKHPLRHHEDIKYVLTAETKDHKYWERRAIRRYKPLLNVKYNTEALPPVLVPLLLS